MSHYLLIWHGYLLFFVSWTMKEGPQREGAVLWVKYEAVSGCLTWWCWCRIKTVPPGPCHAAWFLPLWLGSARASLAVQRLLSPEKAGVHWWVRPSRPSLDNDSVGSVLYIAHTAEAFNWGENPRFSAPITSNTQCSFISDRLESVLTCLCDVIDDFHMPTVGSLHTP